MENKDTKAKVSMVFNGASIMCIAWVFRDNLWGALMLVFVGFAMVTYGIVSLSRLVAKLELKIEELQQQIEE